MKNILIGLVILFLVNFYRKPDAHISNCGKVVRAASYGTIKDILIDEFGYLNIIAFLSPLDVHMQYVPISGIITGLKYDKCGKFNLAYKLGKSKLNEKMIYNLETQMGNKIQVIQVAGFLTRHIKSYVIKNQFIKGGSPLGFIQLGSRVDIRIPAYQIAQINCQIGQRLVGGNTPLVVLK